VRLPPRRFRALLFAGSLLLAPDLLRAQGDVRDEPFPKEKPRPLTLAFKKPENGFVEVEAIEQDWVKDASWVGIGEVVVRYGSMKLQADRMRVDLVSTDVDAEGNVVLDEGPNRLAASRIHFNLTTKLGLFEEARVDLDPDYHFTGRVVEKVAASDYVFEDGIFTSCDMPSPDWSFRVARGEFTIGGYATLHSTSFRVLRAPLLWFPWMLWPVKNERTSGLLIPNIGYSDRRGGALGLAWFQTLGNSADATLFLDGYTKGYFGSGLELRQAFPAGGLAEELGYALWDADKQSWEWKWKVKAQEQNLPGGFRLLVDAFDYSDPEFFRLFERVPRMTSLRTVSQIGSLTTDRGPLTLNLRAERRQSFFDQSGVDGTIRQTVTQSRLPGFELRSRSAQIGSLPLSAALTASVDNLRTARSDEIVETGAAGPGIDTSGSYFRGDLYPRLSAGFRIFPWLRLSPEISLRETWYQKRSAGGTGTAGELVDESIERRSASAQATLVGPSFARIFDVPFGGFARWKHIVEPRIEWRRSKVLGDEIDPLEIPQFDEVDYGQYGDERVTVGLTNRFLAKEGKPGASAREVASFSLSRLFTRRDSDPTGRTTAGPIQANLRINAGAGLYVNGSANWETSDPSWKRSGFTTTNLTAGWAGNDAQYSLTWSGNHSLAPTATDPISGQLQLAVRTPLLPDKKLILDVRYVHSLTDPATPLQRYLVEWRASCWSIFAEYRDTNYGTEHRRDYRIAFNLRDVGTFIDVSGGLDSTPF
jgi:LPS-assembly protein